MLQRKYLRVSEYCFVIFERIYFLVILKKFFVCDFCVCAEKSWVCVGSLYDFCVYSYSMLKSTSSIILQGLWSFWKMVIFLLTEWFNNLIIRLFYFFYQVCVKYLQNINVYQFKKNSDHWSNIAHKFSWKSNKTNVNLIQNKFDKAVFLSTFVPRAFKTSNVHLHQIMRFYLMHLHIDRNEIRHFWTEALEDNTNFPKTRNYPNFKTSTVISSRHYLTYTLI